MKEVKNLRLHIYVKFVQGGGTPTHSVLQAATGSKYKSVVNLKYSP